MKIWLKMFAMFGSIALYYSLATGSEVRDLHFGTVAVFGFCSSVRQKSSDPVTRIINL